MNFAAPDGDIRLLGCERLPDQFSIRDLSIFTFVWWITMKDSSRHKHVCNVAEPPINTHIFEVLAHKGLPLTLFSSLHFMWERCFTIQHLRVYWGSLFNLSSWMVFLHCSWGVHGWLLFRVFGVATETGGHKGEKNVFVSKNITFYFQLQRETCNIFVTLLNKISKKKKHSRQ